MRHIFQPLYLGLRCYNLQGEWIEILQFLMNRHRKVNSSRSQIIPSDGAGCLALLRTYSILLVEFSLCYSSSLVAETPSQLTSSETLAQTSFAAIWYKISCRFCINWWKKDVEFSYHTCIYLLKVFPQSILPVTCLWNWMLKQIKYQSDGHISDYICILSIKTSKRLVHKISKLNPCFVWKQFGHVNKVGSHCSECTNPP